VICGRIDVPESHDAPNGKIVPRALALLKTCSRSPSPDPVIHLHGRPGGHAARKHSLRCARSWTPPFAPRGYEHEAGAKETRHAAKDRHDLTLQTIPDQADSTREAA